jgi:hypothetical protein
LKLEWDAAEFFAFLFNFSRQILNMFKLFFGYKKAQKWGAQYFVGGGQGE